VKENIITVCKVGDSEVLAFRHRLQFQSRLGFSDIVVDLNALFVAACCFDSGGVAIAALPDQVIRKRRIRAIIFISSNIVPFLTILIIIPGDYFQPQPMPETLRLEDAVEFAENPEPRCPCILLLDMGPCKVNGLTL